MKIVSTIFATLMLFMANAQTQETVNYEVNTRQAIQSLRLHAVNGNVQTVSSFSSIGNINDSTVCLHLNPSLDYELLVNNTELIHISSRDIRDSIISEDESSPISLVSMRRWIISED